MSTAANALVEHEGNKVAPISESAAIFQIIERAARDPNVDLDKMERLMSMRERELDRVAKAAFSDAMQAAQAEMPQVVRDAANDQTRSRYARYETISEAMQPVITKHGFSLSFGEADSPKENHLRIVCDVSHREGFTKQYHADIPFDNVGMKGNANKTATHAFGSTMSYGKRYLKTLIFDVAVKNEDDDGNRAGNNSAPITAEQRTELQNLIETLGWNVPAFCEWAKIEALPDLSASQFPKAKQALETKIQQKGAAK